ncbi:N-acyl homoserine lactonase family protein [Pseudohalocynthiibacter aestuariivivens]|uniref:N-acyl homoserine lactonase family protein n=1 Tax=Pseudohalocynthiibacter aestuariivivens TaxID=1591409 RepID=A0ABV5J9Q8_9RHOB|nr:N-acyl homoserine lactonase family protein [Pseudohalocynthiibacter aestuariivivens]MBS9718330.1 N-acyl homoserine lactonase family protein [Pseudohalocynthiibacter aestuariivivens]
MAAIETDTSSESVSTEKPINSVSVLRSGDAEQHKEHRYGSKLPKLFWVFFGRSWVPLPLQFFLIEHRDGPILFDTGIDPAVVTDPGYIKQAIGRFLLWRIFKFNVTEQDRADHVLERAGVAAGDIRTAVISHLHFDHVGGIAQFPQAYLLVSAREWAILSEPNPEREWILREHIEIPSAKWTQITFEPTDDPLFSEFDGVYDVAGDGSMILLPTPGHTPGSISMLIRQDGWDPILLVADLTYETTLLEDNVVPGVGDRESLLASFAKVRRLKERLPDLKIAASHDFSAAETIASAMGRSP